MSKFRDWHDQRWLTIALLIIGLAGGSVGLLVAWPYLFPGPLTQAAAAYRQGDWNAASAAAAARLKVEPADQTALRILARTAVRLRRDASARGLYARLGGAATMMPEDFYLFGTLINRLGDRETARECWVAGPHADPDHAELIRAMALDSLRRAESGSRLRIAPGKAAGLGIPR
jgi:hypothetical protein